MRIEYFVDDFIFANRPVSGLWLPFKRGNPNCHTKRPCELSTCSAKRTDRYRCRCRGDVYAARVVRRFFRPKRGFRFLRIQQGVRARVTRTLPPYGEKGGGGNVVRAVAFSRPNRFASMRIFRANPVRITHNRPFLSRCRNNPCTCKYTRNEKNNNKKPVRKNFSLVRARTFPGHVFPRRDPPPARPPHTRNTHRRRPRVFLSLVVSSRSYAIRTHIIPHTYDVHMAIFVQ